MLAVMSRFSQSLTPNVVKKRMPSCPKGGALERELVDKALYFGWEGGGGRRNSTTRRPNMKRVN